MAGSARLNRTLVSPIYNEGLNIEVSCHFFPSYSISDLSLTFPHINLDGAIAVIVMQKSHYDLVNIGDGVENEKNRLLESFNSFANDIRDDLSIEGFWVDFIDPCSGVPVYGPDTARPYDEVSNCCSLLGYQVQNAGCCKILLHPRWGSSVYPATIVTTAPSEAVRKAVSRLLRIESLPSD